MPYKRELVGSVVWMASYYVPNAMLPLSKQNPKASRTRIKEPAEGAGYPNTEKAAGQLERKRRSEIAAGTYVYEAVSAAGHTAQTWLNEWSELRTTRYRDGDKRRVEIHFLTFRGFGTKPLASFQSADFRDWARHGKRLAEVEKTLSAKTFWDAYGVVHKMFEDAVLADRIPFNPCKVDVKVDMPRKKSKRGRRYEEPEVQELAWSEALPADVRMLLCLLAFTGERVGEGCGHIWSDWGRDYAPMTALELTTQYDREPLKGDTDKERPRVIPVHPELEAALDWWHREGWEAFVGRAPRPSDPIIPNVFKRGHHSDKSVYHRVKDAFDAATAEGKLAVPWKAHHALRHAFITALTGRGASELWVERITHNAKGKLVDPTRRLTVEHYTHTEWKPLCDVVALLPWRRVVIGAPGSGGGGFGHTPGHTSHGVASSNLSNRSGRRDSNSAPEQEQRGNKREKGAYDGSEEGRELPGNSRGREPLAPPVAIPDSVAFEVALREHPGAQPPNHSIEVPAAEPVARITLNDETVDESEVSDAG